MAEMNKSWTENVFRIIIILLLIGSLTGSIIGSSFALPVGPNILFNSTTNATPQPAAQITTAGGSFTTLQLNVTGLTNRWKAYVGNVSGRLTLDDADGQSIFDWSLITVSGEVYATRANTIDWSTIDCVNSSVLEDEDIYMNMSLTSPDTINQTFNNTVHRQFYVGTTLIPASTCRAISTYVNDAPQTPSTNNRFQEILLSDEDAGLVYSTIINQSGTGYNGQRYDFQMIVPENELNPSSTTYYLYVELS